MGLKTTGYPVATLGITLESAYAKVGRLEADRAGNTKASLEIQQSREAAETLVPLEAREINFTADKTLPLYQQAYISAKSGMFAGWTDDISQGE